MKSASFYAAYIVKKLWTLAAVLLVLVALLISILRFSLPYMDEQKSRIENYLNSEYGVELKIGSLDATWSETGPSLVLKDVYLEQNSQSPIGLNIDETLIEFDFWGSVLARQIQSRRFDLSGLNLSINLARIQTSETEFPIVDALERLFLEQLHRFSISNSVVDVITRYDQQLIQIQQLRWVNKESHHQGIGQLRVVELANNSATFTLDLYGDKDNLNGTFYAKGEEIDLSPWLNQLVRTQNQLTESRGNFTFWAGVEKSRVSNVQIDLKESAFSWKTPDTEVSAAILGGNIRGIPDEQGWTINVDDLALTSSDKSLITSWTGHIGWDGNTRFNNRNPVNVNALLPVLPLLFDRSTLKFIDRLSPAARVDELALQFGEHFYAQALFSQVAWQQVDEIPGFSDLSGTINIYDQNGWLELNGVAGEIKLNNTLEDNIFYQNLNLTAQVAFNPRGLFIHVPEFSVQSDSINVRQQFSLDTKDNTLSLKAAIDGLSIDKVKALFPKELMGADTYEYLKSSMLAGTMQSAKVLWQGQVDQFPYSDKQGVFLANVELRDATLKFDPEWPALTELDINLNFANESLSMTAEQGKLMDVQLQQLYANIPSLTADAVLTIDAQAHALSRDVSNMLNESSLADNLGQALKTGINIDGELNTRLHLHIPLSDTEVVASGKVNLQGNTLYVPSIDMTLTNASGVVEFVNEKVVFSGVDAFLFDQPVTLDFAGNSTKDADYQADILLSGDWHVGPLLDRFNPGITDYVAGRGKWSAQTNLKLNQDDYQYSFKLTSDLLGINSSLPAPLNKESDIPLYLVASSHGDNQASTIKIELGDKIVFDGILPHDNMQFSRAHLAVGNSDSMSMGLGFSIFADVKYADFDDWYTALSLFLENLPASEHPILTEPQRVYVNAQTMVIAGQPISQLELVAKHSTEDWLLEFNAEQIRAKVTLYGDWLERGIDVKADFINLQEWQGERTQTAQQPILNKLPPVKFECKNCQLFGKDLGKVEFALSRVATGMSIDSLKFTNRNGKLDATGNWFLNGSGYSTALNGELNSSDFGALLKGFGLDSGIKDSKAKFEFDLSWQDSPHKFTFASLNGDVNWRLTDGYLSDVSDKGARIFSLLSLQSLVRKLSLDFRDVFAKGFFYDKMKGSVQIANGVANTQDTLIDGAAGEMRIAGNTDLDNRTLDYQIEFTPNVTSSLPLLVYWMVNPASAIAALALDKMLTEAKVISNVRYSVTGTLDDPVMTEVDRKSKDVVLPAQNLPQDKSQEQDDSPDILSDERVSLEVIDG